MLSDKHIFPALAAVLVAAAFVLFCVFAPVAYADTTVTSSVVNDAFDALASNYNLSTVYISSIAVI